MSLEIKVLQAYHGDCIWLRHELNFGAKNIIVDSGTKAFAKQFRNILLEINEKGEMIDLLIISHCDSDHIGGFLKLLSNKGSDVSIIREVWINDGRLVHENTEHELDNVRGIYNVEYSVDDAITVIDLLNYHNINYKEHIKTGDKAVFGPLVLRVVSPTEFELNKLNDEWKKRLKKRTSLYSNEVDVSNDLIELMENDKYETDLSIINSTSISVMIEYDNDMILLAADSSSEQLVQGLEECYENKSLCITAIKIPHHGSKYNTNEILLKKINTSNYIISTNGYYGKPSKNVIARMLNVTSEESVNIFSNYDWWTGKSKFTKNDKVNFIESNTLKLIELSKEHIKLTQKVIITNG